MITKGQTYLPPSELSPKVTDTISRHTNQREIHFDPQYSPRSIPTATSIPWEPSVYRHTDPTLIRIAHLRWSAGGRVPLLRADARHLLEHFPCFQLPGRQASACISSVSQRYSFSVAHSLKLLFFASAPVNREHTHSNSNCSDA